MSLAEEAGVLARGCGAVAHDVGVRDEGRHVALGRGEVIDH